MLQSMRNKIKGLVAIFLIALLTIPLALVGVESFFYGNSTVGEAAEVNGMKITEREVQLALSREKQRLTSQLGDQLPAEYLSDERLRGPVLDRLVDRALIAQAAIEGNMTFSNAEIDQTIVDLPDFQVDGQFNSERFKQLVRNIGHTAASFRTLLKEDMLVNQLREGVLLTDFITDKEIAQAVALSRQTRDFSWVTLPLGNLTESVEVTAEEVAAFYDENKSSYTSEELVAIEYIKLDIAELAKGIDIDEEEARQQYQQIVNNFVGNTIREAAHIMIEGSDEAAQQKINTVQEKLSAGEDFAALASEYSDDFGTRDNGGNLGTSTGDAFPEGFENVLATMSEGQISEPTEIDGATHFIKLVSVTEKTPPSYEQQQAAIIADLQQAKAENQFIQDSEAVIELAYNASSLKDVAQELGLVASTTGLFSRNGGQDEILRDSRVVKAAFSQEVLEEGHSSDLLELSSQQAVVIKVIDHKPVRTLSLDEKRKEITDQLKLEKAKAQLVAQAAVLRESLDQGSTLQALSEKENLALSSQTNAQRNAADVPKALLDIVFAMAKPEAEQTVIAQDHLNNGDYVLISLANVSDGNVADLADVERDNLGNSMSSSVVRDEYSAWQSLLESKADVNIYSSQPTL